MNAPTLHTARLVLRPYCIADFADYAGFVTSDRAVWMGGPHDMATAWAWFCNDTAQWALLDMGGLMMTCDGGLIGQVALCHGPAFPEPELGWFLFAGHEGKGFAFEAAAALRDWAFGVRGLSTMVSSIDPENLASIKLAQRLGGFLDSVAATPSNAPTRVYRYAH